MRKQLPPAQPVISDYQSGLSSQAVATKYGISPRSVRNILERHGVPRRPAHIGPLKHGHTSGTFWRSREYQSWQNMLQRCENPKNPNYPYYGGRGIAVCAEWHAFTAFLASMGSRPAGTSLDRINNGGNYEPGNCRWATARQQGANRRTSITVQYGDFARPIGWVAARNCVPRGTVGGRIYMGWDPYKAATTPPGKYAKRQQ